MLGFFAQQTVSTGDAFGDMIAFIVGFGGAIAVYLLPSFIAMKLDHPKVGNVLLVNLLLGWTVLGWVLALIWSFTKPPAHSPAQRLPVIEGQPPSQMAATYAAAVAPASAATAAGGLVACPWCAELIQPAAKICRYCSRDVASATSSTPPAAAPLSGMGVVIPPPWELSDRPPTGPAGHLPPPGEGPVV